MSNNPFGDAFKSFYENIPAWDASEAVALGRKNIEACSAACQAVAEGVQAVAQRQFEIIQSNVESTLEMWKQVASSKDPKESATKQADFAKNIFEKSIEDSRELAEIASKSNNKVIELVNRQVAECIKECSKAASQASSQQQKKKAAAA